jgi:outer membrane receptor protein involved in Fe transport
MIKTFSGALGRTSARRLQLGSAALLAVIIAPGFAAAQSAPAPAAAAAAGSTTVGELVITAEKRSGTVQSTPMSITAVSGAQLLAQGVSGVTELGYETPGVSERNSGPGQTEYEMRGVSSSGGAAPTVGFYLDDTPLTSPAQSLLGKVVIDPNLYDLNRVEVLRGPQGTLYGSSSMGGTIKLVTNQPDPKAFATSVQAVVSDTQNGGGNYDANMMINIPLAKDVAALRLVGTESYTSGWISRKVLSPFPFETDGGFTRGDVVNAPVSADYKDTNWERLQAVRAAVLWQPDDHLTITPSVLFQTITQGAPNYIDNPPGIKYETHYQPFDVSEPYSDSFALFSLPIKYDFGGVQLSSSTAYFRRQTSLSQDTSEIGQDFMEALILKAPVSFADAGPLSALEKDHTHQFSEEVRLTSTGGGPFQWLVGGFYEDYTATTGIGTTTPGPIAAETFGVPSYFALTFRNRIQQYAGFGEASYSLGAFKLTAGLRYYSYSGQENLTESGGLISGTGPAFTFSPPSSASGVSPKVNLSYEPNRNLTLYLEAAKGFRPGGGNPPSPNTCPNNPLQYGPDGLWSYEAGEKARLFDNRLTINGSVYLEQWTGIQQLVTEACGATFTANAGTANVYGGELEATLRLTSELTLTTSAGYTHATIATTPAGTGFSVGERIQDVPDWTDTTSIVYRRPVFDDYDLVLRATNEYVGTMVDPSFNPINTLPARDIVNLRAGLQSEHKVSAFLFINNATDKRANLGDPEEIAFFVPALNRVSTNQPRTIGVELDYALGGR